METIHSTGKALTRTGANLKRLPENSILFEEIIGEGLSELELYHRNMEEYVPMIWKMACYITRNV